MFGVALFYSFVVLNNITDYDSNYQFVRHVLMMDSTFPGNHGMWRAINSPAAAHRVLCVDHRVGNADDDSVLVGRGKLARALRGTAANFQASKAHGHHRRSR